MNNKLRKDVLRVVHTEDRTAVYVKGEKVLETHGLLHWNDLLQVLDIPYSRDWFREEYLDTLDGYFPDFFEDVDYKYLDTN